MRRLSLAVLALLVVLAVGHSLVWRYAAARLEAGFTAWEQARRADGWTVRTTGVARGGWPTQATLEVTGLSLEGGEPDLPGGLAFATDRAELALSPLHPRVLTVSLAGGHGLRVGDAPEIPFRADRLVATFPLTPGARSADIDASNLRAGLPSSAQAGDVAAGGLTVALLQMHFDSKPAAAQGEPAIAFTGSAEDIALPPPPPPATAWPLGGHIASISIEGAVNGPLPRAPDITARATGWRDGGGTLEIRRLAIGWGPLGLTGSATLALDDRMQPMGAATVHILGQNEALDALAAGRAIAPQAALAAKAVLSLMTRQPEGGGAPQVEVPLTLQKQTLSLGRIPLARLPQWVWPSPP